MIETKLRVLTVTEYDIVVQHPELPVVNVGTKDNPSYLPAAVCHVRPWQPAGAKLSPNQGQQMIRFAVRQPAQNARSISSTSGPLLGFEPTNATLVRTILPSASTQANKPVGGIRHRCTAEIDNRSRPSVRRSGDQIFRDQRGTTEVWELGLAIS